MQVITLNAEQAQNPTVVEGVTKGEPHVWISIRNIQTPFVLLRHAGLLAELPLMFDDVDEAANGNVPMNEAHAKMVHRFLNVWEDRVNLIGINCQAGLSRSVAMAKALREHYNGEIQTLTFENRRVFELTKRALQHPETL